MGPDSAVANRAQAEGRPQGSARARARRTPRRGANRERFLSTPESSVSAPSDASADASRRAAAATYRRRRCLSAAAHATPEPRFPDARSPRSLGLALTAFSLARALTPGRTKLRA